MIQPAQKPSLPAGQANSSLFMRSIMAVLLTIGFYGLALGIASALLYIVYVEITLLHRINVRITLGCLIGAGVILWAILPRPDHFTIPGALLVSEKHPRLFETIQNIAKRTGQKMPAAIYLVLDANAFVAERGGFMGIGRKRIMGIGLPLLQTFSVSELEAMLAHEFGHFYRGDTSLGPWVYQTRMAIIRTVMNLQNNSLLQAPFRWYGELFLRITQAVSRNQEFLADALAATVSGSQAVISSLKKSRATAPVFSAFMKSELLPVIQSGYRPPLADGFTYFTQANGVSEVMDHIVVDALKETKHEPYDSHPSMTERILAVQDLPAQQACDDTPAFALINPHPELEREMMAAVFGPKNLSMLKPIQWEEVGESIYLKRWKETITKFSNAFQGLSASNLLEFRSPQGPVSSFVQNDKDMMKTQDISKTTDVLLGIALSVMLADNGWKVTTQPGSAITLTRDGMEINPSQLLESINESSAEKWAQTIQDYGIADLKLAL